MGYIALGIVMLASSLLADPTTSIDWTSPTTGASIKGEVQLPTTRPADPKAPLPTVIYLKNLSAPRLGTEPDDAILADFRAHGCLVLVLDYAKDAKATSPALSADILKLRQDLGAKKRELLAEHNVDLAHVFIVAEGCRVKRDVEFARDGNRVLAMDVIYPSGPARAVHVLMEFSCDNKDRMGNSSLVFCQDTLVEGAPLAGFAAAMVDHPVAPPYKGLDDPMPQVVDRARAAAAKLREIAPSLGSTTNIGALGFSRGGPFAAFLAAHRDVQAALVHGNRYDYLNLIENDPMFARFEKAWGKRDENKDKWAAHGVMPILTRDASPMFLNTSSAESAEYQHGLKQLAKRLDELGVEHVHQIDNDERGHRVTTDPKTLSAIYKFFGKHLAG